MTKKLGHPYNEEFAIGAVGLEDAIIEEKEGISPEYIERATAKIRRQLKSTIKSLWANDGLLISKERS